MDSDSDQSPIALAARGGHEEAVQALLEHDVGIEKAFYNASDGGQVHLLQYLLQKGVHVHAKSELGGTIGTQALEQAIIIKNPGIISMLVVDLGVPINDPNPPPFPSHAGQSVGHCENGLSTMASRLSTLTGR